MRTVFESGQPREADVEHEFHDDMFAARLKDDIE
jgi:hypothetical protein